MEVKPQKQSKFKNKRWLAVGGVIVTLAIGYGIGESAASEEINGEKVKYDKLVILIDEKENELEKLDQQLNDIESEVKSKQKEFDEAVKIIENRDTIQSDIEKLESQIDEKQSEIASLDEQIQDKQKELASLEGKIQETGEKPIDLPSGTFIVGSDLPANRYKVTTDSSSGNFVVYNSSGKLKVNQILGTSFGETEHIFFAEEGDVIETNMKVKLIPVE
jgi:prefoldin subunit 5